MNKYLYYENKLFNKINKKSIKYKCKIQLVDNLSANACVLKYNDQYLIYVSKKLNKKLLSLVILHEFGQIYCKTINTNPKKYNCIIEFLSNFYALCNLLFLFSFFKKLNLIFLVFFSEKKLYKYYFDNIKIGGTLLYEKIFET